MATFSLAEVTTVNTSGTWTASDAVWASGFGLWLLPGFKGTPAVTDLQTSATAASASWTMQSTPSTATQRAIAYTSTLGTNGRAVLVGNGVASWSDDGINWNAATSLPEANNWCDVKFWPAQSIFIMCASSGTHRIATSADGKSWTNQTAASALSWEAIHVSATVAVCLAFSSSNSTQLVQTSADGAAWTLQTHASLKTNRGTVGGGAARLGLGYSSDLDMFLWTGTDGTSGITAAYRSTDDGVTWTASSAIPTISSSTNRGYLWLDTVSQWYMPCANGFYGLSSDGDTFTVTALPGGVTHSGYTPMGWDGISKIVGGSTLGFDTALVATVTDITAVSPATGSYSGGTVCTITGVGLSAVAQGDVLFGTSAALSVSPAADGRSLTCITPAHAVGAVNVTITGIGTLTNAFTYVSVVVVTPKQGTAAGNVPITITGSGFNGTTSAPLFGTTPMPSYTVVSNTSITGLTPAHTSGLVNVTVPGVDTGTGLYTFFTSTPTTPTADNGIVPLLPPVPFQVPVAQQGGTIEINSWGRFLTEVKQRIEGQPPLVAEQVAGVFGVAQIPQLPSSHLTFTNSPRLLGTTLPSGISEEISVVGGLVLEGGTLSARLVPGGYTVGDIFYADSLNSIAALADVSVGSYLRSGGVATAPLWSTLKLPNAGTVGDVPYVSATNVVSMLADVAAGSYLRAGGVATAPLWSTVTIPNAAASGDIWYGSATSVISALAKGSDGQVLWLASGLPAWTAISALSVPYTSITSVPTATVLGRNTAGTGAAEALGTLPSAVQLTITATGALNAGSITSGFGAINIGVDTFQSGSAILTPNTGTLPTPIGSTVLQVVGADASAVRMEADTFGGLAQFNFRRANGVAGTPTHVNADDVLGNIIGSGYGSTGYSAAGRARVDFVAAQNWTDAAHGTYISLVTTPNGTVSVAEAVRIHNSGGVSIGNTTDPGLTNLSVTGTVVAGAGTFSVSTGVSSLTATQTGTGAAQIELSRSAGTTSTWDLYIPSGSTDARLYNGGDRFTFKSTGEFDAATLALTGKATTYNNITTAGWGVPAIYAEARATAQTTNVTSVAAYTIGAADGSAIVSANVNVTTSTTHNFTVECAYTDETNTPRVLTFTFSQLSGVFVAAITNVTGAGPYEGVPMHIRCKASTSITIRTQAAGTYTTVTYNVEGCITQIA